MGYASASFCRDVISSGRCKMTGGLAMKDLQGTEFEDHEQLARWTKGRVQRYGSWHTHDEGVCFDKSDMMSVWQKEHGVTPKQADAMYQALLLGGLMRETVTSVGSSLLGKFRVVLGGRAGRRSGEYKCTIVPY